MTNNKRPHYNPKTTLGRWFDKRLPIARYFYENFIALPVPAYLNIWWIFGGLLVIGLLMQWVSGIALAMHYTPTASGAFASVIHIVRRVRYGWLLQSLHVNGATFFFIALYAHIGRSLYYGSYKNPRELVWLLGMALYIGALGTAFLGYTLVWGQVSYWSASVLTNLVGAFPFVGPALGHWIRGGATIGNNTIHYFFILHMLGALILGLLAFLHIWSVHVVGNSSPHERIIHEKPKSFVSFHPHYTFKYGAIIALVLAGFAYLVFYHPFLFSNPVNMIAANPLRSPAHIQPAWYLLPYYALLSGIPWRQTGILLLAFMVVLPLFLPWLDRSPLRKVSERPVVRSLLLLFIVSVGVLGWCGTHEPYDLLIKKGLFSLRIQDIERLCALYYFSFFLILLPLASWYESINFYKYRRRSQV